MRSTSAFASSNSRSPFGEWDDDADYAIVPVREVADAPEGMRQAGQPVYAYDGGDHVEKILGPGGCSVVPLPKRVDRFLKASGLTRADLVEALAA